MIKDAHHIWSCLTQNLKIFNRDSKNAVIMIVTSFAFFVIQHDSTDLEKWKDDTIALLETSLADWSFNLSGKFECVVLDKAHMIHNEDIASAQAIYWLNSQFYLCLTAISDYNEINDFEEFQSLILAKNNAKLCESKSLHKLNVSKNVNFFNLENNYLAKCLYLTNYVMQC